jgi:hypothetical protein
MMLTLGALAITIALVGILVAGACARVDRPPRKPVTGTTKDPRVEWMDAKQRAYGRWLRKKGRTLLADCEYEPELHAGNVIPIRRKA